jgi:hypothetical protein
VGTGMLPIPEINNDIWGDVKNEKNEKNERKMREK